MPLVEAELQSSAVGGTDDFQQQKNLPTKKAGPCQDQYMFFFGGRLLSADCWVLCIFQSLTALPVLSDLFSYRLDSLRMAQEHRHEIKQTMNACILVLGAWTQHLL